MSSYVSPLGKTIRQNNLEQQHTIPLGALVEIKDEDGDTGNDGVRLFVVRHSRDCDGTPLYDLSFDKDAVKKFDAADDELKRASYVEPGEQRDVDMHVLRVVCREQANGKTTRHWPEDALTVIKLPE